MLEAPVVAHKSTGGTGSEQASAQHHYFLPNVKRLEEIQEENDHWISF